VGTETDISQRDGKREGQLSADGKWRSFPKVPNLLQYVNSGIYYGRNKIKQKVARKSLETKVWSIAKVRLVDFLKESREVAERIKSPKFKESL
jgi:hypothetical protein